MRHIRDIKDLPISQLTDEEIVKATMHRLKSSAVMLVYEDTEDKRLIFLGRYRKEGRLALRQLQIAWEEKFGKFKKLDTDI